MVLFMYTPIKTVSNKLFSLLVYDYSYFVEVFSFHVCRHLFLSSSVAAAKERIYPVADATTFFTDMHYILRVLAAGDIRTVCYKRLNLLEQVILLKWFFQCLYLLYVFEPSNKICEILQWQQKVVQYSRLHAMLIYNLKHIAYKRIPDVAKIFLCI